MEGSLLLPTIYRSICMRVCVHPSKRIHAVACCTNGTTFGTHMQINLEMVVRQIKISCVTYGAFGGRVYGVKTSNIWKNNQTAVPIDTKFGTHFRIYQGMDMS